MAEQQQVPLTATLTMDPASQALIRENMTALSVAQSWVIDDADMADAVAGESNRCKGMVKVLEAKYKEFVVPATQILEAARNLFKPAIQDLEEAVDHYNGLLVGWREQEQKRIAVDNAKRDEDARKTRAEAEAKAQAERARAAEEARQKEEQARRDAEARQKAENEAREAAEARQKAIDEGNIQAAKEAATRERAAREEAQKRAAAEAKAQEQARAVEAEGAARAQQFILEADASATAAPREEMRDVAGTTFRGKWVAEMVVDELDARRAICAAVAARPDLLAYVKLDLVAIGRAATAQKKLMNIPGFVAKEVHSPAKSKGA